MRSMPAGAGRIREKTGSANKHTALLPKRPRMEDQRHTKSAAIFIL